MSLIQAARRAYAGGQQVQAAYLGGERLARLRRNGCTAPQMSTVSTNTNAYVSVAGGATLTPGQVPRVVGGVARPTVRFTYAAGTRVAMRKMGWAVPEGVTTIVAFDVYMPAEFDWGPAAGAFILRDDAKNDSTAATVLDQGRTWIVGQWSRVWVRFTVKPGRTVTSVYFQHTTTTFVMGQWWEASSAIEDPTGGPYFDGSTPPVLRENQIRNPRFAGMTYWDTQLATGTPMVVDGRPGVLVTCGPTGVNYLIAHLGHLPPGMRTAGRMTLVPTASTAGKSFATQWYDGATYGQRICQFPSTPGEPFTFDLPSDRAGGGSTAATAVRWYISRANNTGAWVGGEQFYAYDPLVEVVEQTGVMLTGPYFDPGRPLPGTRGSWSGTPDGSPSYLTTLADPEWEGTPNATPSTLWSTA